MYNIISMKKIVNFVAVMMGILACSCNNAQTPVVPETTPADPSSVVMELISSRRSIRSYQERPVNRDTMQIIMNAGILAPSGMNKQSYEVRVVDNPEFIAGLTEAYVAENPKMAERDGFKNMFNNAPTVAFVGVDGSYDMAQIDCGLLGQNMLLSAWSMGIGSCVMGMPIRFMNTSEAAKPYLEKLGFSEGINLLYCIAFGYPAETPDAKPRVYEKAKFVD